MWQLATSPVPPPSAAPWTPAIRGLARRAPTVKSCSWRALIFVGVAALLDFGEVHAGAEGLAVGGEQDGADGGVGAAASSRAVTRCAAEGGIQGVALVGAIEGEAQQASLASGMQKVGHRVWGRRKVCTARSTPLA